jgi:hypothetical protein
MSHQWFWKLGSRWCLIACKYTQGLGSYRMTLQFATALCLWSLGWGHFFAVGLLVGFGASQLSAPQALGLLGALLYSACQIGLQVLSCDQYNPQQRREWAVYDEFLVIRKYNWKADKPSGPFLLSFGQLYYLA